MLLKAFLFLLILTPVTSSVIWSKIDEIEDTLFSRFHEYTDRHFKDACIAIIQRPELHNFYAYRVLGFRTKRMVEILEKPIKLPGNIDSIRGLIQEYDKNGGSRVLTIVNEESEIQFKKCIIKYEVIKKISQKFGKNSKLEDLFKIAKNIAPFMMTYAGQRYCASVESIRINLLGGIQYLVHEFTRNLNSVKMIKNFVNRLLLDLLFTLAVFHNRLNLYHGSINEKTLCLGESRYLEIDKISLNITSFDILLEGYEEAYEPIPANAINLSWIINHPEEPPEIRSCQKTMKCVGGLKVCCKNYIFDPLKREEVYMAGRLLLKIKQTVQDISEQPEIFTEWNSVLPLMLEETIEKRITTKQAFYMLAYELNIDMKEIEEIKKFLT